MTQEELNEWYNLITTIKTGTKLDNCDYSTLLRLNHLIMEEADKIHNDNMLGVRTA